MKTIHTMRKTIHQLRERPKEDRLAVAGSVATGVVVVLFVGWIGAFFIGQNSTLAQAPSNATAAAGSSSVTTFEWQQTVASPETGTGVAQ
jgi:hypothetical protein